MALLFWSGEAVHSDAFTGTTELMGYIEEIDLSNLTLVVDGQTVEFAPNIPVNKTNGNKLSIFKVSVGEFVNVKVIPFKKNWKGSRITVVNETRIKSITSYIASHTDERIKLGNGQLIQIPKRSKLEGFDTFQDGMVIKIHGYISGNTFKIWKFNAPYNSQDNDYRIYGELTRYQADRMIINSKIVIMHDGFTVFNENGIEESDLVPSEGMTLRVSCHPVSNVLHLNECELFESIHLTLTRDSDTVIVNQQEETIPYSITSKKRYSLIPIKSIFNLCSLPIHIDKDDNIIKTRIDNLELTYNMNTGELCENGNYIKNAGFSSEKKGDEYMVPINVFAFLFCNDHAFQYPLIASEEDIIILRD